MDYQLMHKHRCVAEFSLDEASAAILRVGEVLCPAHLPVGIPVRRGTVDRAALNDWWQGRAIPASRQGIRRALDEMHVSATPSLLDKCMGLSLSDQYWIRPVGSELAWERVNFFENPFSEDVGNILFGHSSAAEGVNLMSPDNTSDGWLRKRWSIENGRRCLIKGGSGATRQEPYNEVFASELMRRLGVPHVAYRLSVQEGEPYSVCDDFITPQTELVSAWYLMRTRRKENHVSLYQHYLSCCDALGIPDARHALNRMLVVDYLLVNEDRHQNNFGAVRNADTLAWLGTAPIYDSGTSLWFDTPTPLISAAAPRSASKPFKASHEEQIGLVTDFDWIDWACLRDLGDAFRAIASGSVFVDEARADAIARALSGRVERLRAHAAAAGRGFAGADVAGDVKADVAYSGGEEAKKTV